MHSKWIVLTDPDEGIDEVLNGYNENNTTDWIDCTEEVEEYIRDHKCDLNEALENCGYEKKEDDPESYGYWGNETPLYDYYIEEEGGWSDDLVLKDSMSDSLYPNVLSFGSARGLIIDGSIYGPGWDIGNGLTEVEMREIIEQCDNYEQKTMYVVDMHI